MGSWHVPELVQQATNNPCFIWFVKTGGPFCTHSQMHCGCVSGSFRGGVGWEI
jgi:hypothetical protein